ncbi:hypothetical protein ACFC18_39695 [Streptomyces sp. NPDC056121]|uniref:hypothetical protein n=1 Tax=Streptomyces sp. NPDC056121 TaxID=3345718 RepID=UPI0035DC855E
MASTNHSNGPRASPPPPCTHCPCRACPDPDSITAARLHQAVPAGNFSIAQVAQVAQVAQRLNTITAHVIYLLSQHPVDWSPPRFRRTQHTATRLGQWRTWHEEDHLSLQDIADREEASLATVRLALKNDVPIRKNDVPIRGVLSASDVKSPEPTKESREVSSRKWFRAKYAWSVSWSWA